MLDFEGYPLPLRSTECTVWSRDELVPVGLLDLGFSMTMGLRLCIEAGMLGGCLAHLLVISPGLVCLLVKGSQLWFDCLWWLFG
jgi:hypothetical protein